MRLIMPNLEPSQELSYLLGVRYGDMSFCSHRAVVRLCGVKDEDFAEEFAYCLGKVMDNTYKVHYNGRHFTVATESRVLNEYFILPLEYQKTQIECYPETFIRGFFDSEGGTYGKPCVLRAYNTDTGILEYIKELLDKYFSIHSTIIETNKKFLVGTTYYSKDGRMFTKRKRKYVLSVCRRSDKRIFAEQIGFSIYRKQKPLMEEELKV